MLRGRSGNLGVIHKQLEVIFDAVRSNSLHIGVHPEAAQMMERSIKRRDGNVRAESGNITGCGRTLGCCLDMEAKC